MPTLQDVPIRIKECLGSERATKTLINISQRAGLATPNSIPRILYLVEIKELSVHDFIDALVEYLGVSILKAKAIAKEIKEQILEFERASLYEWGVDISFIETGDAPDLDELMKNEDTLTANGGVEERKVKLEINGGTETQKVSLNTLEELGEGQNIHINTEAVESAPIMQKGEIKIAEEKPSLPEKEIEIPVKKEEVPTQAKPFMLFEAAPQVEASKQRPTKSLSMPFGFFTKRSSSQTSQDIPRPKPTTIKVSVESAKVETPKEKAKSILGSSILGKMIRKEAQKTVDYNENSSLPTSFKKQDTEIFATSKQTTTSEPVNAPAVTPPITTTQAIKAEPKAVVIKTIAEKTLNDDTLNKTDIKPIAQQVEASLASSTTSPIRKNPFSFPMGQKQEEKPQPKVNGNTVYLNKS